MAEVLTAYDRKRVFTSRVKGKTITGGHSARFKVEGRRSGGFHTPGTRITNIPTDVNNPNPSNAPSDVNHEVINLDGLLIAPDTIYDLDELMEDALQRQETMRQLGEALANIEDQRVARVLFAAATSATQPLAKSINANRLGYAHTLTAGYATASKTAKADELAQAIGTCKVKMMEKDVDPSRMVVIVPPEEFDNFTEGTKVINADFNQGAPNGSYGGGDFARVKGLPVTWSNHVIQSAYTATAFDRNPAVAQDLTKCRALIFSKEAVGHLTLRRLKLQVTQPDSSYNIETQGTLMVASLAVGTGILRREAAACIRVP